MAPVLRLLALVACCFATLVAGQGTVRPADTDAVEVVTKPPAGAPATGASPAATPAATPYVPAPIPEATEDSPTFRKVPNGVCSDDVAQLIQKIYTKNRVLFDTCAQSSKYQIFPFSGKLPTPEQIHALATTKACTALFTACVLADLPQCDISELGLKSVVETLLKVTVDIDNGKPTPDTMRFHYLHLWRRDSNLALAAGVPFGNDSALYKEYSTNLWTALTKYNVHVLPDLSIEYNVSEITTAMNGHAGPFSAQSLSDHSGAGSHASSQVGDDVAAPSSANGSSTPSAAASAAVATHRISTTALCATIVAGVMGVVSATL